MPGCLQHGRLPAAGELNQPWAARRKTIMLTLGLIFLLFLLVIVAVGPFVTAFVMGSIILLFGLIHKSDTLLKR